MDEHTDVEWDSLRSTAQTWCARCPVRVECGVDADRHRHLGLWAGVYRRIRQGRYEWETLVDGAPEPQVADHRSGSRVSARGAGWVA